MSKDPIKNDNEFNPLKTINVAYNEESFLLVLNATNDDFSDGATYYLPAEVLHKIVNGLEKCGQDYQKKFNKYIGFDEKEV